MEIAMLDLIDRDDVTALVQGLAYAAIAGALAVGVAATAGLAWTVLKITGGL